MYNCKKATELLEKQQTEKLSWWTRLQLRIHLFLCPPCQDYSNQSQQISQWIKENEPSDTTLKGLSEKKKQQIIKNLKKRQSEL